MAINYKIELIERRIFSEKKQKRLVVALFVFSHFSIIWKTVFTNNCNN